MRSRPRLSATSSTPLSAGTCAASVAAISAKFSFSARLNHEAAAKRLAIEEFSPASQKIENSERRSEGPNLHAELASATAVVTSKGAATGHSRIGMIS